LDWAAACWPERAPWRLETLAQRLGGEAAEAMRKLDRVLYAEAGGSWDGKTAWRRLAPALKKAQLAPTAGAPDSPLPPLYPQHAGT